MQPRGYCLPLQVLGSVPPRARPEPRSFSPWGCHSCPLCTFCLHSSSRVQSCALCAPTHPCPHVCACVNPVCAHTCFLLVCVCVARACMCLHLPGVCTCVPGACTYVCPHVPITGEPRAISASPEEAHSFVSQWPLIPGLGPSVHLCESLLPEVNSHWTGFDFPGPSGRAQDAALSAGGSKSLGRL